MIRHLTDCLRGPLTRAALLLALAAGLMGPAPAQAQWEGSGSKPFLRSNPKFLDAFRSVVTQASRSTVRVQCDGEDVALGTIVGADGWILTKAGELKAKIVCKLKDGRAFDARIVGVMEVHDVALLQIDAKGLVPVVWRSSKEDPVGSWVASVGLGEQPVAVGVISVAARKVTVSPGSAARTPVAGGYLGIGLDTVKEGVKIIEIKTDSAAARAGLKENDLVLSVSGQAVKSTEALQQSLQKYKPGELVALLIQRGEEKLELKAKLGKRPPIRADVQNNMGSELSQRRVGFPDILQHDSVVKPKDCGGPLVDLDGKVIGINIARAGRTESYAIPAEVVQRMVPQLIAGKWAPMAEKTQETSK